MFVFSNNTEKSGHPVSLIRIFNVHIKQGPFLSDLFVRGKANLLRVLRQLKLYISLES